MIEIATPEANSPTPEPVALALTEARLAEQPTPPLSSSPSGVSWETVRPVSLASPRSAVDPFSQSPPLAQVQAPELSPEPSAATGFSSQPEVVPFPELDPVSPAPLDLNSSPVADRFEAKETPHPSGRLLAAPAIKPSEEVPRGFDSSADAPTKKHAAILPPQSEAKMLVPPLARISPPLARPPEPSANPSAGSKGNRLDPELDSQTGLLVPHDLTASLSRPALEPTIDDIETRIPLNSETESPRGPSSTVSVPVLGDSVAAAEPQGVEPPTPFDELVEVSPPERNMVPFDQLPPRPAPLGPGKPLILDRAGRESDVSSDSKGALPGLSVRRGERSVSPRAEIYRLRFAPDRTVQAIARGATPATEAAVEAALAWLARNQEPDGRWDAVKHGAGVERFVAGRDRQGAGRGADTGMSGLALLAFLGAGHTHQDGPYRPVVQRGIDFLVRSQKTDGSLGGNASHYAFMYCHAMALFALGEALALTGDERLRPVVEKAVAFTIECQDPVGGGWRYLPKEAGDTSQLGWQLLALKSAEYAGVEIPQEVYQNANRFLASVSSGSAGGLAAYRAVERPSRPMTAEALACRIFLQEAPNTAAAREAAQYLMGELPGYTAPNFYYWYYGTLALYQMQDESWHRWNAALRQTLVTTQRKDRPYDGSWDPNCLWGGYGGRVYTTALATLCLEVYYRYLPILQMVESYHFERVSNLQNPEKRR